MVAGGEMAKVGCAKTDRANVLVPTQPLEPVPFKVYVAELVGVMLIVVLFDTVLHV